MDNESGELQNSETWDFDRAETRPAVESAGAVVAVRFNADDFALGARRAERAGPTLSAFIHAAALVYAVQRTEIGAAP